MNFYHLFLQIDSLALMHIKLSPGQPRIAASQIHGRGRGERKKARSGIDSLLDLHSDTDLSHRRCYCGKQVP